MSGETAGGVDKFDSNYRETVELTLPISADEILKLNYDNTAVYSSRENPDVNCIEITLPNQEGSVARVHRIFERLDLMSGLVSFGFTTISERYASKDRVEAYAEWVTSDCDEEWAVITKDGISLSPDPLEAISHIAHSTPVVELQLDDEVFEATYNNTHLFYVGGDKPLIASYMSFSKMNDETGIVDTRYLFDVLETMEDLEAQGFPVTKQPYPSNTVVAAYALRFANNIDKTLEHMRGGDEATSA